MQGNALSLEESETLYRIYRRDVAVGWPWCEWALMVRNTGCAPMRLRWVVLPHRIESDSPRIWKEECALYERALKDHAMEEFGLEVVRREGEDRLTLQRPVSERVRVAA